MLNEQNIELSERDWPGVVLVLYALLLGWFYLPLISLSPLPSVDLPGHVALVQQYHSLWWRGSITFYDTGWFSGWPAFEFYGFLAHWFAAILCTPLSFLFKDSADLATNLACWIGIVLLPFSFYYAFLPIFNELTGSNRWRARFAILLGALVVWFLNIDAQRSGVGVSAVIYSGLFGQLFAWHFLLLHLGFLIRSIAAPVGLGLAISFSLLILVHPMTALFSLLLVIFIAVLYPQSRLRIALAHLYALLLTAFWSVPMLVDSISLTIPHPAPPEGDLFAILFRYRFSDLARAIVNLSRGEVAILEFGYIAIILLILLALFKRNIQRSKLFATVALFTIGAALIFSSESLTALPELSIHYYRYNGLIVILVLGLLAAAPGALFRGGTKQFLIALTEITLSIISVITVLTTVMLPEPITGNLRGGKYHGLYSELDQIAHSLEESLPGRRVLFESPESTDQYAERSPHYLSAKLHRGGRVEVMNGLFIQSSLTNHFVALSAEALGLRVYTAPLAGSSTTLSPQIALAQLQSLGITDLIVTPPTAARLQELIPEVRLSIGNYRVLSIAGAPRIEAVKKPIIGYLNNSELPFTYLALYFYLDPELWEKFQLISINAPEELPSGLAAIIASSGASIDQPATPIIELPRIDERFLKAPNDRTFNPGFNRFALIKQRLDLLNLKGELLPLAEAPSNVSRSLAPTLSFAKEKQSFSIDNVLPGEFYRVNYSYTPNLASAEMKIYRGLAERLIVLPSKSSATITYRPSARTLVQIAYSLSGFCLVLLLLAFIRSLFISARLE